MSSRGLSALGPKKSKDFLKLFRGLIAVPVLIVGIIVEGGPASLRSRTCVKRNAVFGARFKGLSLHFLNQKRLSGCFHGVFKGISRVFQGVFRMFFPITKLKKKGKLRVFSGIFRVFFRRRQGIFRVFSGCSLCGYPHWTLPM